MWLILYTLCGIKELTLSQGHSEVGSQTLTYSQTAVGSASSGRVGSLHFKYKCFDLSVTSLFLMCLLWTGHWLCVPSGHVQCL